MIFVIQTVIKRWVFKGVHALEARKEGEIKYFKDFRYDDKIC